jgi:hypothetical protein
MPKNQKINLVPFSRALLSPFLLFVTVFGASAEVQIRDVGISNGWRELRVEANITGFSWCGPSDVLVVAVSGEGIRHTNLRTGIIRSYKGNVVVGPTCSVDGKVVAFRVAQGNDSKVVVIRTDEWAVREFAVRIPGITQLSADGNYLFFSRSQPLSERDDGLYSFDTRSGQIETVAAWGKGALPVLVTTGQWVSQNVRHFVAPPDWGGKAVVLMGGARLAPVRLRSDVSRISAYKDSKWADSWVWSQDGLTLVTLNWHTPAGFLVTQYGLFTHTHQTVEVAAEHVTYMGAKIVAQRGNGDIYIETGSIEGTGSVLLKGNLRDNPIRTTVVRQNMFGVSMNAAGTIAFGKVSGTTFGRHINEISKDPKQRFVELAVIDENGNEATIKKYYWRSEYGPWESMQDMVLSPSGQAIAFSQLAEGAPGASRSRQVRHIVIFAKEARI